MIKSWIISIISLVVISIVVLLILPDGKTKRLIKNIFQITVVLVTFSPITKISLNSASKEMYFNEEINNQDYFVDNFIKSKVGLLVEQCNVLVSSCGLKPLHCDVGYEIIDDNVIKVKFVMIFLSNEVIISNEEHIVVIEQAINTISKFYDINNESVMLFLY